MSRHEHDSDSDIVVRTNAERAFLSIVIVCLENGSTAKQNAESVAKSLSTRPDWNGSAERVRRLYPVRKEVQLVCISRKTL